MSAAIWEPGTALVANSQASIAPQRFTATAGQTLFPLTVFSYVPNSNSLWVFVNGVFQKSVVDYAETSTTSFTLTTGCNVGDVVDAIGMVSVTGTGMSLAGASDLLFTPDATYDIGKAAGTNRPRDVVASRDVYSGSLTALRPVFSDANNKLVSNAITGSGNVVMSTSPTISAPVITGHPTIEGVVPTGATGTGNLVFSASPTVTGTLTAAAANFSGTVAPAGLLDISGAAAGQIKFPATQNPSANANTLDDYEEGTWTPILGGSTTYTSQGGNYVKIGIFCGFNGDIHVNAIGTGSTTVASGLPFTSMTANNAGCAQPGFFDNLANNIVAMFIQVDSAATSFTFRNLAAAAASSSTAATFANNARVRFSGTYLTAG